MELFDEIRANRVMRLADPAQEAFGEGRHAVLAAAVEVLKAGNMQQICRLGLRDTDTKKPLQEIYQQDGKRGGQPYVAELRKVAPNGLSSAGHLVENLHRTPGITHACSETGTAIQARS